MIAVTEHDYGRSLRMVDQLLKESPADPDALILRGNILDLADRLAEARSCYEQVLVQNARNIRALIDLGDLEAYEANIDSALDLYNRALSLLKEGCYYVNQSEEFKEAYSSKILALRESGRLEELHKTEAEARQICSDW